VWGLERKRDGFQHPRKKKTGALRTPSTDWRTVKEVKK